MICNTVMCVVLIYKFLIDCGCTSTRSKVEYVAYPAHIYTASVPLSLTQINLLTKSYTHRKR
jgi:hypothetical protein